MDVLLKYLLLNMFIASIEQKIHIKFSYERCLYKLHTVYGISII